MSNSQFSDLKSIESESFRTAIEREKGAALAGQMILKAAGEDLTREGLLRTPQRFASALMDLVQGYEQTAQQVVGQGIFEAEGTGLVSVRGIEFYSLCEHHLLPFWGTVSVAYYPNKKIVGLSKIPRLVDLFAKRFQVQERLTFQIVEALNQLLAPRAVVCQIKASHLCMMMRGVEKQNSDTVTESHIGLEQLNAPEVERLWASLQSL